jgi:hypothetical protein
MNNFTMGLGLTTSIPYGLVGIGYAINEAAVTGDNEPYANLPVAMMNSGHISTPAYSLWLNDLGNPLQNLASEISRFDSLQVHQY